MEDPPANSPVPSHIHPLIWDLSVCSVPVPHTSTPHVPLLISKIVMPILKITVTNFPSFDGHGHAQDFLEKFYNFRVTHWLVRQQIISILFTQLKRTAAEWYTAEFGNTPPTEWDQVVLCFGSYIRKGLPQLIMVMLLSTIKIGKNQ